MKARVQRLRAELAADRQAFEARLDELADLTMDDRADPFITARAAIALHHGYGAVEAALLRLARFVGEGSPEGPDWHAALLTAMALEIEDVRPAVIGQASVQALRRLLAFRHFFRHAYAVELDPARLAALREVALQLRTPLGDDLRRLDSWLAQLATSSDG